MDSELQVTNILTTQTASTHLLDEYSLAIVRGGIFIDRANWFIRKVHRLADTAIRIGNDELLRNMASKFCRQHLDKFFPNVWTSGYPNAELVYEEVLWQYRNLRAELLNKSRLRRPLPPECLSEPIAPPSPPKAISMASPPARALSQPPSSRKRRRKRHRHRHKTEEDVKISAVTKVETNVQVLGQPQDDLLTILLRGRDAPSEGQHIPQKLESSLPPPSQGSNVLPERPSVFKKMTPLQVIEQIAKLKESCHQRQAENERLASEIKTLSSYRIFVERSLGVCRDTYLAEAQSAEAIGLKAQTAQCDAVVEVLRDLQSDLDFKYFHDHYRLHGREPPSRFWLDGIRQSKQKRDILRS